MSKNKKYTGEFKEKVVRAYLSGLEGGPIVLARKYGISSATQIKVWTKKYKENPKSLYQEARGRKATGRPKSVKIEDMTLEEQNKYLKMENTILKKLEQLIKENP